jgi:hypothetical protein
MSPNVVVNLGTAVTFIAFLWGIAVTVAWLYIAWRAMRAHEKLSQAAVEMAQKPS